MAVAGWVGLIAVAVVVGLVSEPDRRLRLGNVPPFIGHARLVPPSRWLLPVTVAGLLIVVLPAMAQGWPLRRLLAGCLLAAAGWAVVLAASDGWSRLWSPLETPWEYRSTLPALRQGVGPFLQDFTALPTYSIHTQGQPPGPVLVLHGPTRLGLTGAGWEAVLVIAAGSSAVAAVAIAVRASPRRPPPGGRCLSWCWRPPRCGWPATSMDAFFLGVTAWGLALLALADRNRWLAPAGGLLLGAGLYLSYALLAVGPLAPVVLRDRRRSLPIAAARVGAVVVSFSAAGFWWPSGLAATHTAWAAGVGTVRQYGYSWSPTSPCSPSSSAQRPPPA